VFWEWKQQLRQWGFVLSLWLPLVILLLLGWGLSQGRQRGVAFLAVWDETGRWIRWLQEVAPAAIEQPLVLYPLVPQDTVEWEQVLERVVTGQWLGILRLGQERDRLQLQVWGTVEGLPRMRVIVAAIERRVRAAIVQGLGLPEAVQQSVLLPVAVAEHYLPSGTFLSQPRQLMVLTGLFLLTHALVWATRVMTEERLSRVAELLLSVASAAEIVGGKFISLVAMGIGQTMVLVGAWSALGIVDGDQVRVAVALGVGYSFMAALGLWLTLRTQTEAQLHGAVTLLLLGLFTGPLLAVWSPALLPVLIAVPLWMPSVVSWLPSVTGTDFVVGIVMSSGLTAALLWGAAGSVSRLFVVPGR